jgi:ion channel POLLUX/CASTOR
LDPRISELISVEKSDDFVMSERIVNLMLAQLSENPDLEIFFNELMQPQGSEIYFRKISHYIDITKKVKFGDIAASALNNSETAIGYRINAQSKKKSKNFGIYVNPRKSDEILFSNKDEVIVFSDN